MMEVTVKVPASTANLGPGLDAIGMALSLYTTIQISRAPKLNIQVSDERLASLRDPENNLVYQGAKKVLEKLRMDSIPLQMKIASQIPLKRGLGSSGAAIVGGMVGMNALLGFPLTKEEIFQMAAELEGHADNVGASLFGGLIVTTKNTGGTYTYLKLDPPPGLKAVVAIPDLELRTVTMRDILPSSYSKDDTVFAVGHVALLVGALATGKVDMLSEAMQDTLHQPYRSPFVPCLDELLQEGRKHGALGAALSGAGPSLIAFTKNKEEKLVSYLKKRYAEKNIAAEIGIVPIDTCGARVENSQ